MKMKMKMKNNFELLVFPKVHSCFYNSMEIQKRFSGKLYRKCFLLLDWWVLVCKTVLKLFPTLGARSGDF